IHAHGHAIEVRLYAEDPDQNFLPGSGKLEVLRLPEPSAHVRLDGGVVEGDTVSIFYDPMIAKLIVYDANRTQALERMRQALGECRIIGPKSNIGFLERLVRHPIVIEADIDTGYLDRHLDAFLAGPDEPLPVTLQAAACVVLLHDETVAAKAVAATDPHSPWAGADAWRIGLADVRQIVLTRGDMRYEIDAHGAHGRYRLHHENFDVEVDGARIEGGWLEARFDGVAMRLHVFAHGKHVDVHDPLGRRCRLERAPAHAWDASEGAGGNQVIAPMPGRIVLVKAKAGDSVEEGQDLVIMESMKMELALKAPRAGSIETVSASEGDFVEADSVLVRFSDD
ncbi:MAG TPA: biotin/lipoyl-containing protein, partial [Rhodanobacteraceae bacterium]|nr:biotin/lipoyl-containing protein [Rhodanobacteraceae bacterium]